MKTDELVKKGIKRNTLRELEIKGLIKPKRVFNKFSDNKTYAPREYSQDDLERIWKILLYQKMGLDNDSILKVLSGQNIGIWDSMTEAIRQKENELEELKVLLKFMKLVKSFGSLPLISETLGSCSFVDFMNQYINEIERNGYLSKLIRFIGCVASGENENKALEYVFCKKNVQEEDVKALLDDIKKDIPNFSIENANKVPEIIQKIANLKCLEPSNKKVQDLIEELYQISKQNTTVKNMTRKQFVEMQIFSMDKENDFGQLYFEFLGNEGVNFFEEALIEYLIKNNSELINNVSKKDI